jgi:hypothetical protein
MLYAKARHAWFVTVLAWLGVTTVVVVRCDRSEDEAYVEPVVEVKARNVGKVRGTSARKPEVAVEYVDKLVLNYCHDLTYHVTGFTRFSDPGLDPYKRTYASVHFLPGSARPDLYDPNKPFRKRWTKVDDRDLAVAVPKKWRHLFEERIEMPDGYWFHRYRIWCDDYPSKGDGKYAIPRCRITKLDRFDFFFSVTLNGRTATERAYDFTDKRKTFEIWRLDWVKVPKQRGER